MLINNYIETIPAFEIDDVVYMKGFTEREPLVYYYY